MNKKIGIIGTGVAAVAMAAVFGVSGLLSNAATAAARASSDSVKAVKTAASATAKQTDGTNVKIKFQDNAGLTTEQRQALNSAVQANIKSALADLISKGTITQEQADTIAPSAKDGAGTKIKIDKKLNFSEEQTKAITSAMENARKSAINSLVDAGTITQEVADKLSEKNQAFFKFDAKGNMANLTDAQREAYLTTEQANIKDALADLVSKGTITQEIADMFAPRAKPADGQQPAQPDKTDKTKRPDITDAQMTALKDAMKTAHEATLSTLVKNGTITQEIADQLKDHGFMIGKGGHVGGAMVDLTDAQREALMTSTQTNIKAALADLVKSGVFSQELADKLVPEVKSGDGKTSVKIEKTRMTDVQEKAFQDAMKKAHETAVASLLANGTITQDIADKLKDCGSMMGGSMMKFDKGPGMAGFTDAQREAVAAATQNASKTALAALVTKGTITQEMADAFAPSVKTVKPADDNEKSNSVTKVKLPEVSDDQMKAIRTAIADANKTALAPLVQNGTITQAQADKLCDTPMMGAGHGMGVRHR